MSAMNTASIVDGFAHTILADEVRIKERMAQLIKATVEASTNVGAPQGVQVNDPYAALMGNTPSVKLDMGFNENQTIDERLDAAAEMLFEAYD